MKLDLKRRKFMEVVVVKEDGSLEFKEVERRRLKVKSVIRMEDEDKEIVKGYLKSIGKLDEKWNELIDRVRFWLEDEEIGFCIYK